MLLRLLVGSPGIRNGTNSKPTAMFVISPFLLLLLLPWLPAFLVGYFRQAEAKLHGFGTWDRGYKHRQQDSRLQPPDHFTNSTWELVT